eukprot:m.166518 g.166518  ORF g.166518 m.166518 type:complete len:336 (-) comp13450_c0_seq2:888-1895(-)
MMMWFPLFVVIVCTVCELLAPTLVGCNGSSRSLLIQTQLLDIDRCDVLKLDWEEYVKDSSFNVKGKINQKQTHRQPVLLRRALEASQRRTLAQLTNVVKQEEAEVDIDDDTMFVRVGLNEHNIISNKGDGATTLPLVEFLAYMNESKNNRTSLIPTPCRLLQNAAAKEETMTLKQLVDNYLHNLHALSNPTCDLSSSSSTTTTPNSSSSLYSFTPYLFDRGHFLQRHPSIQALIPSFRNVIRDSRDRLFAFEGGDPFTMTDNSTNMYVIAGKDGSGVGFHQHTDSVLQLHQGTKVWMFVPPDAVPVPRMSLLYNQRIPHRTPFKQECKTKKKRRY